MFVKSRTANIGSKRLLLATIGYLVTGQIQRKSASQSFRRRQAARFRGERSEQVES